MMRSKSLYCIVLALFFCGITICNSSDCTTARSEIFSESEISSSISRKRQWHDLLQLAHREELLEKIFVRPDLYIQDVIGPVGPPCKFSLTSFGTGDDEKRACLAPSSVRKMGNNQGNGACVVYSIGSNNQWSFELAIYAKTDCKIETFDCTCDGKVPGSIQDRTRFHKICLGSRHEMIDGKQYIPWREISSYVGSDMSPSFLKIDIEGWEHGVVEQLLEANRPTMIAIEVHSVQLFGKHKKQLKSAADMYLFFDRMYIRGGYHVIDIRDNPRCMRCLEVLFSIVECTPPEQQRKMKGNMTEASSDGLSRVSLIREVEKLRVRNRLTQPKSKFCNRFSLGIGDCP